MRTNHRLSKKWVFKKFPLSLYLLNDKNNFKRSVPGLSELTLHKFGLAPDRALVALTPPYLWQIPNTLFRQHLYWILCEFSNYKDTYIICKYRYKILTCNLSVELVQIYQRLAQDFQNLSSSIPHTCDWCSWSCWWCFKKLCSTYLRYINKVFHLCNRILYKLDSKEKKINGILKIIRSALSTAAVYFLPYWFLIMQTLYII